MVRFSLFENLPCQVEFCAGVFFLCRQEAYRLLLKGGGLLRSGA
jgi:hypothetical protein